MRAVPWPLTTAPDVTLTLHGPAAPTRPVAVVLHGVGSTADFACRCLAAPLRSLGYDVVAPDLRGHGASTPLGDPEKHSLDHHVADLDVLASVVDVRLVAGISLGAEVALHWAGSQPVQKLDGLVVCLPGVAGPASTPAAANRATAAELNADGVAAVLDRMASADQALPWVVKEVRHAWTQHAPASLIAGLRAAAAATPVPDDVLATIAVPVGIVAALDDAGHPLSVARRLASLLREAALETLLLTSMADDRSVLGRSAVRALTAASHPT